MVLVEVSNWLESRTAVIEHANDCIYVYNHNHNDRDDFRALWLCNTLERDSVSQSIVDDMKSGNQPYLPNEFSNKKSIIVNYENEVDWEVQWGLDQNSLSVFFKGSLIAVMPEWSGYKGFNGYSLGVSKENELAWPLLDTNEEIKRVNKERSFLTNWNEETWPQFQENILEIYKEFMKGEVRYFAADEGKWPPLGLNFTKNNNTNFWSTVGMSLLPMPQFGMAYDDPSSFRNIELAILVETNEDTMTLGRYLSAQAKYPWYYGTHFDHGHTIPCRELNDLSSGMTSMLIVSEASFLSVVKLERLKNSARLLFMIPIYQSEQQFAEEHGSSELLKLFKQSDVNVRSLKRDSLL